MHKVFESVKPGNILYANFIWDDTRIPHFYKVLKKTESSVRVQEIDSEQVDKSENRQWCMVVPGTNPVGKPKTIRLNKWGWLNAKLTKFGSPMYIYDGSSSCRHSYM